MDSIKTIVSQIDNKTNEIKGLMAKLSEEIDAMKEAGEIKNDDNKGDKCEAPKKKRTRKILTDEEKQAKKAKMQKKKKEDEEEKEKEEAEDYDI